MSEPAQREMIRLGRWQMRGHIPPFPLEEAPEKPHDADCRLCGEHEFKLRQQRDELASRRVRP